MSYDSDKKNKRGGKKFNKKFFEEEYELVKEEGIKYINESKCRQFNSYKEKKNTNDKFSKPRNYIISGTNSSIKKYYNPIKTFYKTSNSHYQWQ